MLDPLLIKSFKIILCGKFVLNHTTNVIEQILLQTFVPDSLRQDIPPNKLNLIV
ncbi:hypothetical protein KIH23_07550 [Flavobacterium sp. CYK-55]|uniref:hypothetical protein n=1 Tax=Flavobacterium sp. CYK-55 TaxID=2835529 RepID=UPI001BCCB88A|nr:hypothetical protein [Flavobacterium sp. CYK-55]MBS7787150.1 hypothetical protein [Flavobacterium sp. CYK-55]